MSDIEEAVAKAAQSALDDQRVVGGVVLVLRDGEELVRHAFGLADRERGTAMAADRVFRLSSLTKPIVTTTALHLVDGGSLDLHSPITRWLPSFRPALASGETPDITLHHLLTHTSGLSYPFLQPADGPYNRIGVSSGFDCTGVSFAEELDLIARAPLSFAPGSAWLYSVGLDVAGAVIEAATGGSLPEVVASLVTSPLGMASTGFAPAELATPYADGDPPVRMAEGQAVPLYEGLQPLVYSPARAFDPVSFSSGGAGMNGSAPDFARFLESVRVAGLPENRIGDLRIDVEDNGGATAFGYGGSVLVDPALAGSPQSPGTWLWGGVWGHTWWVDPTHALTVVQLTNSAIEGMQGQLADDILTAVYSSL